MKKLHSLFTSNLLMARFGTYLAATATVGMLALGATALLTPAQADSRRDCRDNRDLDELQGILQNAQVAELDQLLADFHGALSYGGNITAMMSLWAKDSSLSLNGTTYNGKAAVQSFFANGPYFLNNWVSLAPEYKTQITLHGNKAEFTTQCVAIDLNATPMVVKSVIQVTGTAVRVNGNWIFKSMNNTSPAPL